MPLALDFACLNCHPRSSNARPENYCALAGSEESVNRVERRRYGDSVKCSAARCLATMSVRPTRRRHAFMNKPSAAGRLSYFVRAAPAS